MFASTGMHVRRLLSKTGRLTRTIPIVGPVAQGIKVIRNVLSSSLESEAESPLASTPRVSYRWSARLWKGVMGLPMGWNRFRGFGLPLPALVGKLVESMSHTTMCDLVGPLPAHHHRWARAALFDLWRISTQADSRNHVFQVIL